MENNESKTKILTAENEDVKITIELKTPKSEEFFRFKRDLTDGVSTGFEEITFDKLPDTMQLQVEDVVSLGEGFIIID